MCGVIGAWFLRVEDEGIDAVRRVILESQIRGKHATGVSYIQDGVIKTVKRPVPAEEFLEDFDLSDCINEDGGLYLIAHTRYSTSDIRYNQPISNGQLAIVHNGVISQESKDTWMYETETTNDSELVLKSFEINSHPLIDFPESSMAVCVLDAKEKTLRAFRNHERPLWYTTVVDGIIFTSTRDIALRSNLWGEPNQAEMFVDHCAGNGVVRGVRFSNISRLDKNMFVDQQ